MQALFYGGMFNPALDHEHDKHDTPKNATNEEVHAPVMPPLLSVDNWKHSKAFTKNKRRDTQTKYYTEMNAAPEVIDIVSMDSKPFGSVSESILAELFQMTPRTSSQHDGVFEGHKCEIKCARGKKRKHMTRMNCPRQKKQRNAPTCLFASRNTEALVQHKK